MNFDSYIQPLESIVQSYNATLDETDFKEHDGFVFRIGERHHIVVDKHLSPYKKRFAVAHECGHIRAKTVGTRYNKYDEFEANEIAVGTLISDEDFIEALEKYGGDYSYLCPLFGVSEEVIERKFQKMFSIY